MKRSSEENKTGRGFEHFRNTAALVFWALLIVLCFVYRDKITVENIVGYTPDNIWLAVLLMMCLFVFKSVTIIVYVGILYAASGIMFSLPVAIAVNIAGTFIMMSITYFIGRRMGAKFVDRLTRKNKKFDLLGIAPNRNEWFICFLIRLVGILPADLVGMHLGASGIKYKPYVLGGLVGILPMIVCFSIMGMSIDDIGSPEFIISAAVEIGTMVLSLLVFWIIKKKDKKDKAD